MLVPGVSATDLPGAIVVDAPEGYPEQLLMDLSELLSDYEGADTRCVFKAGSADLDVDDIVVDQDRR